MARTKVSCDDSIFADTYILTVSLYI